jgi:hypothetical protein
MSDTAHCSNSAHDVSNVLDIHSAQCSWARLSKTGHEHEQCPGGARDRRRLLSRDARRLIALAMCATTPPGRLLDLQAEAAWLGLDQELWRDGRTVTEVIADWAAGRAVATQQEKRTA